jgi:hypothetical protein
MALSSSRAIARAPAVVVNRSGRRHFASKPQANPFAKLRKPLAVGGKHYEYFDLAGLKDSRLGAPFSCAMRLALPQAAFVFFLVLFLLGLLSSSFTHALLTSHT